MAKPTYELDEYDDGQVSGWIILKHDDDGTRYIDKSGKERLSSAKGLRPFTKAQAQKKLASLQVEPVYEFDGSEQDAPPELLPPLPTIEDAAQLHNQLLALGEDLKAAKQELKEIWAQQSLILSRFANEENLCKAVGCDSWAEYVNQYDVAEALGVEHMSPSSRSHFVGKLLLLPYAKKDVFAPGRTSKLSNAMGRLQQQRRLIEAAPDEKTKVEAVNALNKIIDRIDEMPHRDVQREMQSHGPPPCKIDPLYPLALDPVQLVDSESQSILVLKGNDAPLFRILSCLLGGRWLKFYWDEDGFYYWDDEQGYVRIARWARKMDESEMARIAGFVPNCRRRMG